MFKYPYYRPVPVGFALAGFANRPGLLPEPLANCVGSVAGGRKGSVSASFCPPPAGLGRCGATTEEYVGCFLVRVLPPGGAEQTAGIAEQPG